MSCFGQDLELGLSPSPVFIRSTLSKLDSKIDPLKHPPNQPFIGGTIRSFKDIVHNEGIAYQETNEKKNEGRLAAWQHLISSVEAGLLAVVVSNPIWVIKTRMCATTRTTPDAYKGL
ncbi:hypothetical protein BCR42DRAFT_432146 [Absidia repens]|uniref:Mitochondrial carrier domain-containing protein n=1 Tax=Absidia repens TaxID=90262 RepID=A0A1X2IY37_9FUNG|nr:hypothetical protein BCR42DRAFT_432146 [Absidia repens]